MSARARILVVDDQATNRRILVGALAKEGYAMFEARSGREALECVEREPPDMILLDVAMPAPDGFDVCRSLKSRPELRDIPILFVTSNSGAEQVERAFALGAADYVTKPFHISEVKARVAVHLRLAHLKCELERSHAKSLGAQRLESIGQLAAGIAHEINTPTQYVGDNARFVRDSFQEVVAVIERVRSMAGSRGQSGGPDALAEIGRVLGDAGLEFLIGEVPSAIEQSIHGIDRIAEIVRAMKDFSHPGSKGMAPADLCKAIESTITVARNEWKHAAELEKDFDPALPPVTCSIGDLNQVILNLIVNAAHSIEERLGPDASVKGRIRIATRLEQDWARISVSDDGSGIPAEYRSRIFEPFFTTKPVGKGSGQGLAIARAVVVEMHHGSIEVESECGVGTTFHLRIPLRAAGSPGIAA